LIWHLISANWLEIDLTIGMVGKKVGMTRLFLEEGTSLPVTVLEIQPNRITQIKTEDGEGYSSIQVTTGEGRQKKTAKPELGHFAKAKVGVGRGLWEFRVEDKELEGLEVGGEYSLDTFEPGQKVDVRGVSKGKGFAGTIKRWNFSGQDNTHGNSISHRAPGSIGQCQTPGRVFKGKKMSGHMGAVNVTTQNLEVVQVDREKNLILVKGAVPGSAGGDVVVQPAVKARKKEDAE
jgi:large subunit ribosomal protein L3